MFHEARGPGWKRAPRLIIEEGESTPSALADLRRQLEEQLKPRLERLEGVAAARIRGGYEEEVRVCIPSLNRPNRGRI